MLVRDTDHLRATFSYHPLYYHFEPEVLNYVDLGPQNSRGFRALKVWLVLRQAGRAGLLGMIANDIRLAEHLHRRLADHPEFEVLTQNLSITTFRYVPPDLRGRIESGRINAYLNQLNEQLLTRIEKSGQAFLSNALIAGRFALRTCTVNFRTSLDDVDALPALVSALGRETDATLRSDALCS